MSDTEERIAKLQKLLDRVLSRGDEEPEDEEKSVENGTEVQEKPKEEEEPKKAEEPPPPEAPAALESRSRLVAAGSAPESAEELSDSDLIPDSKVPSSELDTDAVPLVRRSRAPADPPSAMIAPPRRDREEDEELSDGRIVLGLEDVTISDDSMMTDEERLAAEIAAEEVQSGEIEEDAPTSSRRPIALSAEERHTPPPESGKQVAAAPVSSDAEVTAVRKSSSPPAAGPDVIRPQIPPAAAVGSFSGEAGPARPASFGELLDEALEL
jgi:hypothetical protein